MCFHVNFVKFLRTFFYRTPLVAASDYFLLKSHRSSRPEVLCERGVLENFAKFTGKHLCQSLFFNKVTGLAPSGVISNNRFPFSNFVFIICQQNRFQKQNISYTFLLVIISYRKEVYLKVGKCPVSAFTISIKFI